MDYYIPNDEPVQNKGAENIQMPVEFSSIPDDKALICEVDNVIFKANALCYSENEFKEFKREDGRLKKWFLMDKEKAHKLSGYLG